MFLAASEVVAEHWRIVDRAAAALLVRGYVSGDDIAGLFAST